MNLSDSAGRSDAKGLWTNIAISVGFALLVNTIIFTQGWDIPTRQGNAPVYDPPGWLVGGVWVVLFALMGAARWLLVRSGGARAAKDARAVVFLIAFCWLYPFYTLALGSVAAGLLGNLATAGLAVWVVARIRTSSRRAAALVSPVVAWVSWASVLTALMLRHAA